MFNYWEMNNNDTGGRVLGIFSFFCWWEEKKMNWDDFRESQMAVPREMESLWKLCTGQTITFKD